MLGIGMFVWWQLTACLPTRETLPWPTDTPLPPTQTPTVTPVWFPPTATNTPLPTTTLLVTPTQDLQPQYGTLIYSDDFSDASNWILGPMASGAIALGINELTLSVSQSRGYLVSMLQNTILGDFYLEITASPSICRGYDEYGVLVRVTSAGAFYRFALLCNGQARIDRYNEGTASSILPPIAHWAIPPGAPSTSRLAIWAIEKDIRFYANGEFLFAIRDPILLKGNIGLFARASADEIMSVNFSNLVIYEALK